ncbi:solute symporter family transporter [Pholiota conissans]|uniref:Solute symporter family transporter n=1 Tax=Pholiota conissans TaxID=109636 RepID=A0A9P6CV07_9AGAR|nr:solute symporter family transporter [Pholiota conissans]
MSSDTPEFKPLLAQSVGYGVVIGVGFFFALIMLCLTFLQTRFTDTSPRASEEFTTASRNVKPGLVCCGIVSAWTWSATLLQSSTAAYTFGVSGPWWYGVGGTIQLAIFGMVAAKVKMNANGAHTFLEIVKVRFGTGPHLLFTFYAFLCIMVVCGSLLLGGAATVNALTGMNILAACFLLPIGIAVYVIVGGLRATFVCDWSHTLILFIIIYIFIFRTYGTSPATQGLPGLYDLLVTAGHENPVVGNQDGSYLTMKSNQGLVFGAATILSGFSGIFCDQGYWQRAIASHPKSTTKAYMLGGMSWFAVPFAFASCLGLAARGLQHDPRFPTFPHALSASQVSAGLAAPAAAAVVMGKGGAIAVLLVVFMAVTSACSAELIAVSSLFSYDIYKAYLFPKARGPEIVRVSHLFICFWAVWMGCWATILHKAQIDLGWLFYVQGVVLSPAVIPIALTVTWKKLTSAGIIAGAVIGASLGMLAWMIGCWKIYGAINIPNLAEPYSAVCSGLTGLLFSGIITVVVSLMNPADYDFKGTCAIANLDMDDDGDVESIKRSSQADADSQTKGEKEKTSSSEVDKIQIETAGFEVAPISKNGPLEKGSNAAPADLPTLQQAFKRAAWYSLTLTAAVAIIVPLPMFFSHYVFSEKFFAFWISVSIIWALMSGTFSVILPVWESRREIAQILVGCWKSVTKRR